MRRSLLTIIGTVVLVWNALGQDGAEQTKYEIIRETINFLATDKAVSRDTNFMITCETLDYDCFGQQLSGDPVAGIERWYNSWRSMAVSDEAGLAALRDRVFADIFERPGKGYRKQFAGYQGYISRIDQLIDQYANGTPVGATVADTASEPLLSPLDADITDAEPIINQNDNPEKDNTMIAYLAIAIGIAALILGALSYFRKPAQPAAGPLYQRLDEIKEQIARLEERVAGTDDEMKEAVASLTDIMEAIEKRVVAIENR
jgi:hypothetical protein